MLGSGLPAVVIRPSHVYGPGGWYAQELVPRLRQPGRFAVIGSGDEPVGRRPRRRRRHALLLAVAAEAARPDRVYHVADDEPISFYDFMALTASELGVGPPRRIPAALARARGRAQRRRRGRALGALLQRADQARARLAPRFPTARQGVPDAVARLLAPAAAASEPPPGSRRPSGEGPLGLVGDVAGDRQRGGRGGRGGVAHVQRPVGVGEDEVVDELAVAAERLGADAGERRLDVADLAARGRSAPPRARSAERSAAWRSSVTPVRHQRASIRQVPGPGQRVEQIPSRARWPSR